MRISKHALLLGLILLIAAAARIWGIGYDLPHIYHPDEPSYIAISQNIFKTGDLNPHFFNYPSLMFYVNSAALVPYYLVGRIVDVFGSPGDLLPPVSLAMGVTKAPLPSAVLVSRLVTALFGVGTVAVTYLIGQRLTQKAAIGLLAALLVAVSPLNVGHSRFVTPDTFVVFFAAAAFFAVVLLFQKGKTRHYALAGILIGLTAASKYNGGLIALSLLLAHFLRDGRKGLEARKLTLALLLSGGAFLATTPYALLDSSSFLADFNFERRHYATGHTGMEGDSLAWYLTYMWDTAGLVYVAAFLETLRGVLVRDKTTILLAGFPVAYFVFISSFIVRNDKTFLPLTPFLFLLAAALLVHLFSRVSKWRGTTWYRPAIAALSGLAIVSLLQPASITLANGQRLSTPDSRETARIWIANNLAAGAKVAIEPYAPFVEPAQFSVHPMPQMIANEPEWYLENGFDYLVFSEGLYGRYFRDPDRYERQIGQYERLFERFELVRLFTDGGYEVRVYEVAQTAPNE